MRDFEYIRPASVAEAIAEAAKPDTTYLAGGTNLLDLMKGNVVRPSRLVDVTRLPGLDRIDWLEDGGVRVGALVRNSDLAYDARFAKTFPAIAEALLSGASAQLRNAATAAGNILQRTRCQYFYDPASACNKRMPGTGCEAVGGLDRLAAILGWSEHCIATYQSDFAVPLAALGAAVEIEGVNGRRHVPFDAFHTLPGDTPEVETVLSPGDLATAILLPADAASFAGHQRYVKLRERTSYAFAVVSCAAALKLDGGKIAEARVALGSVATKPWRAEAAEQILAGNAPDAALYRKAAEAALVDAKAVGGNTFKIELAKRILVRALSLAAAGTPDRLPALPASAFASKEPAHV